jgi:hypothetical protein
MYTQRSKYWPAYTWKIQTSYLNDIGSKIPSELKISKEDFGRMYFYIFHKINASFYHLQRLKENQEIAIKMGQVLAKIKISGTEKMIGIAGVPYEPIEYEYETFLVTTKSALDFIAILVSNSFGHKEDNISALVAMGRSRELDPDSLEEKVYGIVENDRFTELIDSFKNPGKDKKSRRNFATHKGTLPVGTINIPINNPNASTLLTKALDPNESDSHSLLPSSSDLVDYCENQFYQTCDLLISILSILLGSQLKPGPKNSVYEQRVETNKDITESQ